MIFRRRKGGGRPGGEQPQHSARHAASRRDREDFGAAESEEVAMPEFGPYDVTAAPDDDIERFDFGGLRVPAVADVGYQVSGTPDGQVAEVIVGTEESAMVLRLFAAPRTEGIWEDVREEVRQQMVSSGGAAEEVQGEYGVELRATLKTPDGKVDVRQVGIDGPRWHVQAIFQGAAAAGPDSAGPLVECLRGVIVDRGKEPMPVGDLVPLQLPPQFVAQAEAQAAAEAGQSGEAVAGLSRLPSELASGPGPAGDTAPPAESPRKRKPSPRPRRKS